MTLRQSALSFQAALAPAQDAVASGPLRSSQIVTEKSVATPAGKHIKVTMERVSTGGTRYVAEFERAATCGAMTAAERALKKRKRRTLFPGAQDADRKRAAAASASIQDAAEAAEQPTRELPAHALYWTRSGGIVGPVDAASAHSFIEKGEIRPDPVQVAELPLPVRERLEQNQEILRLERAAERERAAEGANLQKLLQQCAQFCCNAYTLHQCSVRVLAHALEATPGFGRFRQMPITALESWFTKHLDPDCFMVRDGHVHLI